MYETVVVNHNTSHDITSPSEDSRHRKIIFHNFSAYHTMITVVDPSVGTCAEVIIRKDNIPEFTFKNLAK